MKLGQCSILAKKKALSLKKGHHTFHNHLIQNLFLSISDQSKAFCETSEKKNLLANFETRINVDKKPFDKL